MLCSSVAFNIYNICLFYQLYIIYIKMLMFTSLYSALLSCFKWDLNFCLRANQNCSQSDSNTADSSHCTDFYHITLAQHNIDTHLFSTDQTHKYHKEAFPSSVNNKTLRCVDSLWCLCGPEAAAAAGSLLPPAGWWKWIKVQQQFSESGLLKGGLCLSCFHCCPLCRLTITRLFHSDCLASTLKCN